MPNPRRNYRQLLANADQQVLNLSKTVIEQSRHIANLQSELSEVRKQVIRAQAEELTSLHRTFELIADIRKAKVQVK